MAKTNNLYCKHIHHIIHVCAGPENAWEIIILPTKMLQEFGRDMEYGKMLFLFLWFGTSIKEELKNCFKYD